jgi:hypothetical protein
MDCTSSGSELARTVSVLDAVIWICQAVKRLLPQTVTRCFEKAGFVTGEDTASVENENDQQDLQNCKNEAAFSNCNAEDYINIDKDVQTEVDAMDIDVLVQNFRESQKEKEEEEEGEEEEENYTVFEEEKCRLKKLVFVESQAAKTVNCVQKTLLDY